jgi:hypothetical protein
MRWTGMDEFDFLKAEEKILHGNPPPNIGTWKKETSNKIGQLDDLYEEECVKFLDSIQPLAK